MAVDEALMESVRSGGTPTLRLYGWMAPCLSLGRNQPGRGVYDVQALSAAGIGIVRRPTGGRAVLHDQELTYAVVAGSRTFLSARRAYRAVNELLVKTVARLGAVAALHDGGEAGAPSLSAAPCFTEPADGEIVASGRKLVGSAQLCVDGVLLQHGSLPLRRSRALSLLTPETAAALDGTPAYLDSLLGRSPSWTEVTGAIVTAWTAEVAPLEEGSLTPGEEAAVDTLRRRYRSAEWTWRR